MNCDGQRRHNSGLDRKGTWVRKASVARLLYDPQAVQDVDPTAGITRRGPSIANRAPDGFCAALTSFGSTVTEEFWFSNYFSVSLESIVENCKLSIAFATSLGSDEICRLSW